MTVERWKRIEELFHAVAGCGTRERAALLDQACAGNRAMRIEIESLLEHDFAAGTDLDKPALDVVAMRIAPAENRDRIDGLIGARIGQYRLLQRLGVGGMGEVYRAVRADEQFEKQVAIKLVRAGTTTESVYQRFRSERQILASLEHENIASLLDGGTTDDGAPYFVMELVEGRHIDEYCDELKLSPRARIDLFRSVCAGVAYAHQRLVVHRDIKPSNIVVGKDGVPKLLDFGIATICRPDEEGERTLTRTRLITPQFASPEQFRGETVTTATDVYSLGLVLYKLLTGRMPYVLQGTGDYELARAVCETEPENPAALPRDLQAILLKALRKEPDQRYSSVLGMAEDLGAYVAGRPVAARKGSFSYRAAKFVRRHKLGVAALAAFLLVLVVGVGAVLSEARVATAERVRAERRMKDVRALATTLLFDVHDSIQDLPGATPVRQLLIGNALRYLDGLAQESGNDRLLQTQLADGYEKMGDVQGDPDGPNLGDTPGALASYRKALAIRSSLAEGLRPDSQELRRATEHQKIGLCLMRTGKPAAALAEFRSAVALTEHWAELSGRGPATQDALAGAYFELAQGLSQTGDYTGSLDQYRRSAEIREGLHSPHPRSELHNKMRLAGAYGYMSGDYFELGDLGKALAFQTKARDIMQTLLDGDPRNRTFQAYTLEADYWIGSYLQQSGRHKEAQPYFERALAGFTALGRVDPADARLRQYVGYCERDLGVALAAAGKTREALLRLTRALAMLEELRRKAAGDASRATDVAETEAALAGVYQHLADAEEGGRAENIPAYTAARNWYRKSLDMWKQVEQLGDLPPDNKREPETVAKQLAHCEAVLKDGRPVAFTVAARRP